MRCSDPGAIVAVEVLVEQQMIAPERIAELRLPAERRPPAVLVDLEEGVRIVSNLTDVATDDVRIGLPVEVHYAPTAGGPPHATYPCCESEAVIPQRFSL